MVVKNLHLYLNEIGLIYNNIIYANITSRMYLQCGDCKMSMIAACCRVAESPSGAVIVTALPSSGCRVPMMDGDSLLSLHLRTTISDRSDMQAMFRIENTILRSDA